MKILILPNDLTDIIPDSNDTLRNWNVERIMVWGTDLDESLSSLPVDLNESDITYLIPVMMDSRNALSYDGANLAMRILFRYICGRKKGIDVILLGTEPLEAFLRHYDYPNIIKIPGISYCLFNRNTVSRISGRSYTGILCSQYKPFIENLGLRLPSSFKSTHSLTNEWSLYKWNSFMEFEDPDDEGNLNSLYFDYLKAVEKINSVKYKKLSNNQKLLDEILNLKNKGARILLVDDNPRWHRFFRNFFKDSKIHFEAIGEDFRKRDIEYVKGIIEEKVDSFSPDVVLLDFRLIEDKDADSNFNQISGTQVLKELKGEFDTPGDSFGRQVLMFSATSRIENILRLEKLNADGFIMKEKPEQYAGKEVTKDLISGMVRDIANAIDRAGFLIPLNERLERLDDIGNDQGLTINSDLLETISTVSDSVRLATQNNPLDVNVLKLVYLDIFSILEKNKQNPRERIDSVIQRISPQEILKDWNNIDNLRNTLAHGDTTVKIDNRTEVISSELIRKWTLLLCDFSLKLIRHISRRNDSNE